MQNTFQLAAGLCTNMYFSYKRCGNDVSTWAKFDGHI